MAALLAICGEANKVREFKARPNLFETLSEKQFVERYRLPKNLITYIVNIIEDEITPPTLRSHAIPAMTQVLVTLRYLSKGNFLSECADLHGIAKSSVSRSIDKVIKAINNNLQNIHFPVHADELNQTKKGFFNIAQLPGVIGAVDGTLIPILSPSVDEADFVCRKGYHALNIQAVVDADMRFTNIVCKWPGSAHDSFVFTTSALHDHLLNSPRNGWLLGDSGYSLGPFMITPKLNPTTRAEQRFNLAHSRTRVVVERAFGVLKSRFRCLHKTGGCLPFTPQKSMAIIMACMKLHNLCIDSKIPNPDDAEDFEDHDEAPVRAMAAENNSQERAQLIARFN